MWNGEIFSGLPVAPDENDGLVLFNLLQKAGSEEEIFRIISAINGKILFFFGSMERFHGF